jgi:hypothetical protein
MVLIAATAAGLAAGRTLAGDYMQTSRLRLTTIPLARTDNLGGAGIAAMCLVLSWTIALFLLRLRRPRPDRVALFRQPGFAAGASVALIAVILALNFGVTVVHQVYPVGYRFRDLPLYSMFYWSFVGTIYENGLMFGPSVAAAWLVLAGAGCWKPEPSWIDRAGRALGGFWIVATFGIKFLWFLV